MSVVNFLFGNSMFLSFAALISYLLVPRVVASGKIQLGRVLAVVSFICFLLIGVKAVLGFLIPGPLGGFLWNGLSLGIAGWMSYLIYRLYLSQLFR